MLGFSLGKLLLLAIIIAVVWYGFKYMQRVEEMRREMERRRKSAPPGRRGIEAEDLVKCARCGAYVAAGSATNCGRPDCPWGR